jgi:hypothetical protein
VLLASDPPPEVPMFGLGKKAFAGRIGRAVDASLEPGEEVAVSLWTRDPNGDLSRAIFGLFVEAGVASFILTLTDQRVIVHQGNNFNASKSTMLGSYPREEVSVLRAHPRAKPSHLDVRFGGEKDARFTVQALWGREAKAFADGLGAPS